MKIHIATVDVKSKEILSIQITTNERVHDDSKALSGLVDDFVKSNKIIDKLFADDGPMIVMIFSNA